MMTLAIKLPIPKKISLSGAILLSLLLHLPILLIQVVDSYKKDDSIAPIRVKISVQEVKSTLIEAPLPTTEKVPEVAAKGRQNHYTEKQQRLAPSQKHQKGADASRISNKLGAGGKVKANGYSGLLPSEGELSAYNDFVADSSIPVGKILDINTTDYRYIGYTTSIRKAVDLAFYSPRSALKNEPHIKEKLESGRKTRFTGKSVALLTIEKSGLLSDVKIVESSGDKAIDQEWVRILQMAAPFSPIPPSYEEEKFMIHYTLYYDYVFREEKKIRRFQF